MTSLVTWIWQGLLVAGVAGVLVQSLPRLNAATRHVIWWIALLLVVVHPWTLSYALGNALPGSAATATTTALPDTWLFLPPPPRWLVGGAFVVWLFVVALRSWQIVRGLRAMTRLKVESQVFPPARERRLSMWQATRLSDRRPDRRPERRPERRSQRRCELRVSQGRTGACALGFWRPVILLPECLLQALSDEELDQVVMHEHAHLLRYDDWFRLIQCAVGAVLGLHPALWFIGTRIDLEREAACDDHVVSRTGSPRSYSACLAHVATAVLTRQQQQSTVAPSATGSTTMLRARVTRLLDGHPTRTSRLGWMPAIVSALALVAVVGTSGQLPPLVIFTESRVSVSSGAGPAVLEARRFLPPAALTAAVTLSSVDTTASDAGPTAPQTSKAPTAGAAWRVRQARPSIEAVPADVAAAVAADVAQELRTVVVVDPPVLTSTRTMSDLIAQAPTARVALVPGSSAGTARVGDPFSAIGSSATQSGVAIAARAQRFGQRYSDAARAVARTATR